MTAADTGRTRQRILAVSTALFSRQGYAGTSIADIAGQLGTSKAAIYYHFASKEEILDAILARPLAAYAQIADLAATMPPPRELLGRFIDLTAGEGPEFAAFANDPSVLAVLGEQAQRHNLVGKIGAIISALAGPDASPVKLVLARAAFAAAKEGAVAALIADDGRLTPGMREAIVEGALRTLDAEAPVTLAGGGGSGR